MTKQAIDNATVADGQTWVEGTSAFASITITRNLGDFNSVKVTDSLGRPLKQGEHPQEAFEALWDQVTEAASKQLEDAIDVLGK